MSRERFKSSPELPALLYRPRVVDLGRVDDEGRSITSLVMDPVDATEAEAQQARARKRLTVWQRPLMDVLQENGGMLDAGELIAQATKKVPADPRADAERDRRGDNLVRALRQMVSQQIVYQHEDVVSVSPARPFDEDELEKP